jgi:ABC-type oligopeptide transport system substrate-binding subunit
MTVVSSVTLSSLLVFVLSGCARPEPRADLVIINNVDPESLDPALATGIEDLRIVMALFEGLTRIDPETARPVPARKSRLKTWSIPGGACSIRKRHPIMRGSSTTCATAKLTTADKSMLRSSSECARAIRTFSKSN